MFAHRVKTQLPNQNLQATIHPEGITSARNSPKSGEGAFQTGSWNRVPTDQVEQLEQLNQAVPERQGIAWRIFDGAIKRIFALLAISWFGYEKHYQWWQAWYIREKWEPPVSLGPLYFLANSSLTDDWIGYTLLACFAICLVPLVVWPNYWTALLAAAAVVAWYFPHLAQVWGGGRLVALLICLIPLALRPRQSTVLLACFAGVVWVIPGCAEAWTKL
jgi:hypothetical protein